MALIWADDKTLYSGGEKFSTFTHDIARRKRTVGGNWATFNNMLPNPDIVLQNLGLDITAYEELYTDGELSAAAEQFNAGVMRYQFTIEKGKAEDKYVRLIRDVFQRLPVYTIMEAMLDAVAYGYKPIEINWEAYPSGLVLPAELEECPVSWFTFNEQGSLLFRSSDNPDGEELPMYKFLVPRVGATKTNPYGRGNLQRCYWPVRMKAAVKKFWLQFTEDYGSPVPTVQYERGVYPDYEDVQKLAAELLNWYQGGILVHPDDTKVSTHMAGSTVNAQIYEMFIRDCKEAIYIVWLGHTGTIQSTSGQLGSEDAAIQVRQAKIDKALGMIAAAFNELIKWIFILNFGDDSRERPEFRLSLPKSVDKDRVERDSSLVQQQGLRFTKDYYVINYGIDPKHFSLVDPSNAAAQGTAGLRSAPVDDAEIEFNEDESEDEFPERFADAVETNDYNKAVDDVLAIVNLQSDSDAFIDSLFDYIDSADSLEALNENLYDAFDAMDTAAFQESFAKTDFIIQAIGEASVYGEED